MFKSIFTIIFLLAFVFISLSQNRQFAQKTIDTLASKSFYGRGYIKGGDKKAALYISEQFKKTGLKPLHNSDYLYPFSFSVNTFPGKCQVKVDGKTLVPGKDYIVDPACPSVKKSFSVKLISEHTGYPEKHKKIALLYDTSYKHNKSELTRDEVFNLKINLQIQKNLMNQSMITAK